MEERLDAKLLGLKILAKCRMGRCVGRYCHKVGCPGLEYCIL